jgi:hypothetical protein
MSTITDEITWTSTQWLSSWTTATAIVVSTPGRSVALPAMTEW